MAERGGLLFRLPMCPIEVHPPALDEIHEFREFCEPEVDDPRLCVRARLSPPYAKN